MTTLERDNPRRMKFRVTEDTQPVKKGYHGSHQNWRRSYLTFRPDYDTAEVLQ